MAGLYEEPVTGFHLCEVIHAERQANGSLRDKTEVFLRIPQKPNQRAFMSLRDSQREISNPSLESERIEAVFAGLQDGHVALIVRGLAADPAGNVSIERFESVAPAYKRIGFFLGLNGHIRSYVSAHPDWD
jgi:hypothetical protein